jgi:orotidine-5'-phosphate decarboxylase
MSLEDTNFMENMMEGRKDLPKFFVAVDASDLLEVGDMIKLLKGVKGEFGIKINLDVFLKSGIKTTIGFVRHVVETTLSRDVAIFADLKMWNGKRTMVSTMQELAKLKVDMTNVYCHAGDMVKDAIEIANENNIIVLGVTVLTHYDSNYCEIVYNKSIFDSVRVLGKMGVKYGCHGLIVPGTYTDAVVDLDAIIFNPGVRPDWFDNKKSNAQKQIQTPSKAIELGANIVSCGSPVFKSKDPVKALTRILDEVNYSVYGAK